MEVTARDRLLKKLRRVGSLWPTKTLMQVAAAALRAHDKAQGGPGRNAPLYFCADFVLEDALDYVLSLRDAVSQLGDLTDDAEDAFIADDLPG